MTNALKGVLLSALVLPGLGQFVLKRRLRGALLMAAVLGLVAAIVLEVMRLAMSILENIDMQAGQVDVSVIYDAVNQADSGSSSLLSGLLLLCWLAAAVDAYLLGKKMDRENRLPSQ